MINRRHTAPPPAMGGSHKIPNIGKTGERVVASSRLEEAILAIGGVIKRQALILGFSDTFAVIGLLLALAAIALLFARKVAASSGAGRGALTNAKMGNRRRIIPLA